MKKVFIFAIFALIFGVATNVSINAQTVKNTAKKVGTATKDATIAGAKITTKGVHKGVDTSKTVGRKTWNATKKLVKKIT